MEIKRSGSHNKPEYKAQKKLNSTPDKKLMDSQAKNNSKENGLKPNTAIKEQAPTSAKKPHQKKKLVKESYPMTNRLISSYKVTSQTEKERRAFEDKVQSMRNRLNALKKQENDIQRKMNMESNKQSELNEIRVEKECFRNALNSFKDEKKRKLEEQKRRNEEEKMRISIAVKKALDESKIRKHSDFDLARNEKQIIVSLIEDNNEQLNNYNQKKINCIKTDLNNFRAEELRKLKEREDNMISFYSQKQEIDEKTTSRLKQQMAQMEKLEEKYLESLQNTRQNASLMQNNSVLNTNSSKKVLNTTSAQKVVFDSKKDKRGVRSKSTINDSLNGRGLNDSSNGKRLNTATKQPKPSINKPGNYNIKKL